MQPKDSIKVHERFARRVRLLISFALALVVLMSAYEISVLVISSENVFTFYHFTNPLNVPGGGGGTRFATSPLTIFLFSLTSILGLNMPKADENPFYLTLFIMVPMSIFIDFFYNFVYGFMDKPAGPLFYMILAVCLFYSSLFFYKQSKKYRFWNLRWPTR